MDAKCSFISGVQCWNLTAVSTWGGGVALIVHKHRVRPEIHSKEAEDNKSVVYPKKEWVPLHTRHRGLRWQQLCPSILFFIFLFYFILFYFFYFFYFSLKGLFCEKSSQYGLKYCVFCETPNGFEINIDRFD